MSIANENANKQDAAWRAVKTAHVRAYCFTHHDYTDHDEKRIQECGADYILYGYEECPTTHRPHLQGYLYWTNKKKGSMLIKSFPGTHFRVCHGSVTQNYDYCTKAGKIYESGKKPLDQKEKGQTQKDLWAAVAKLVDAGEFDTIAEDYPQIDIMHYDKLLARYYRTKSKDVHALDGELQGTWIYGPAGTGKSSRVYEEFGENVFPKPGNTKWWDQYAMQDTVWVDDFDPTVKNMTYLMKIWTDRWVFLGERKNGTIRMRPKKIVVTSNYTIQQCFGKDPELLEAMTRRFPNVIYIGKNGATAPPSPKKRKFTSLEEEIFGEEA